MTEELKQKAEEFALEKCKECYMCNSEENGERGYCPKYESRIEGYIAGATEATKELKETYKKQRNKRIDELQKKNHDLEAQVKYWKSEYSKLFNED